MEQPNFFETVAAPALQQKCQELFNLSLALETNLRVEVSKNKYLESKLKEYESQNSDIVGLQAQLKQAEANIQSLHSTIQIKQQEMTAQAEQMSRRHQELQITHDQLQIDYLQLKKTLDALAAENVQLKESSVPAVKASKSKPAKQIAATEPDDF